jgi:hypothetical protein
MPANPRGMSDPENGWASAHEAMPVCLDAEGFKFLAAYKAFGAGATDARPQNMTRDAFIWMLQGDNGEDNSRPGIRYKAEIPLDSSDSANWIESGPHLMVMPKDPATLDAYTTEFLGGDPYLMFWNSDHPGYPFRHLMIPFPGYFEYTHTSDAWKIAAYSSASPSFLGGVATIQEGPQGPVLREGTNGWTCMPANPRGMSDPENGWASAHEAMPVCLDAEGFKWLDGYSAYKSGNVGIKPQNMVRDAFVWMLQGDNGEDNSRPGVLHRNDIADPANWVESGPHLMLMPKDPTSLDKYPTDFMKGEPYTMFAGNPYNHLMIPFEGYFDHVRTSVAWRANADDMVFMECSVSMSCAVPTECIANDYEYTGDVPDEINYYGFDHIGTSLMTLFITMTLDEWRQLADPIRQSDSSAANFAWVYFATVTLVAGLVVSNVYVAVIATTFAKVREESDGYSAFAAAVQKEQERAATEKPIVLTASQHYGLMVTKDLAEAAAAEWKDLIGKLGVELPDMKVSELRKRALVSGADSDKLMLVDDAADPKAALIALIVDTEAPRTNLIEIGENWDQDLEQEKLKKSSQDRAKFMLMELKELKRYALEEEGINPGLLASALEIADDPKEELIEVLIGESDFFEGVNINIDFVMGRMEGRGRHPKLGEEVPIRAKAVVLPTEFDDSDTILSIKMKVYETENIPINDQRYIFKGVQLLDDQTLYQQQIENNDTINLVSPRPFPFYEPISNPLNAVVNSGPFDTFILSIVILNTASLCMEHYEQTQEFTDALWLVDLVFNVIYISELLMKWGGIGIQQYFQVPFNILDFSIVCASLLQYAFDNLEGASAGRILRVLRLFRAARLVRAMRKYDAIMILIRTVTSSAEALLNVMFFNLVMLVIFAIMGVHLYGYNNEVWHTRRSLPSNKW